jgi:CHAT domain-containing protein/tetratricopeptide (TPR) repeat protein
VFRERRSVEPRSWILGAGVAMVLLAIAVVLSGSSGRWWHARSTYPSAHLIVALSSASTRTSEGRLSGAFPHRPFEGRLRNETAKRFDPSLSIATAELQQQALRAPSAWSLHAWGVAQLLLRQYDGAVTTLETAVAGAAADAAIRNDLAVAYLERARRLNRFEDWPRAMANAARAGLLDPACVECTFNRATIAQAIGLRHEAIELWLGYVTQELNSDWRAEGRDQLDALQIARPDPAVVGSRMRTAVERADTRELAAIAGSSPQLAREYAEDDLLPAWGTAIADHGAADADRLLTAAAAIAITLRPRDRSLADAIEDIRRCTAPAARSRLAQALVAYGAARRRYETNAIADAGPMFADVNRLLDRPDNPFALWARLHVAIAAYYRGDHNAVREEMTSLEQTATAHGYVIIGARAAWMLGLVANVESDFRGALQHFDRSASVFERAGERYNLAAVQNNLANVYLYVGSQHDLWRNALAALAQSGDDPSTRRRHTQLLTAAHECDRTGFADAALIFQNEALRVDTDWRDPAALAEVHNYRARSLASLGKTAEAGQSMDLARSYLQKVPDVLLQRRLEAEIMQTEVDVLVQTDPRRGLDAADRAIAYFTASKAILRLPRLSLARGRAWETLGAHDRAVEAFAQAARQFELERQMLPASQELRLSHTDELWSAYPLLVEASYRDGAGCVDLLDAAERGRAVTVREGRGYANGATHTLPTLDSNEVILHYTFLHDQLLILTLFENGCEVHTVPVTAGHVQRLAAAWRQELSTTTARVQAEGQELFRLLVAPAWGRVGKAERLALVADGPIHEVPFAALPIDHDQLLIQRLDVRLLPAMALRAAGHHRPRAPVARGLAVVASGSGSATEGLAALPFAQSEAASVSQMLQTAGLTLAVDAKTALIDQLTRATVFHFAGHAVVNSSFPLISHLVLSGTQEPWVTAREIAGSRMTHLQLVVLSACETESGASFGGDGPASLARSFLVSGASQVVATLWPIEDRTTSTFVKAFYTRWLQHGDASAALRAAMLAGTGTRPQDWAAWVAVTAY